MITLVEQIVKDGKLAKLKSILLEYDDLHKLKEIPLLNYAALNGDEETFFFLVENGFDPDIKDRFGFNALQRAAMRGHLSLVKFLIEKLKVEVDNFDNNKYTPLLWAALRNHHQTVDYLISQGANFDHQNSYGSTALMESAFRGLLPMVKLLVEHGAQIKLRNSRGMDALMLALYKKYPETALFLIKRGAETNKGDNKGFTPLMWCSKWNYPRIAKMILKNGAEISDATVYGWTAMDEARKKNNREMFLLLKKWEDSRAVKNGKEII